jgi:hypothetical protein
MAKHPLLCPQEAGRLTLLTAASSAPQAPQAPTQRHPKRKTHRGRRSLRKSKLRRRRLQAALWAEDRRKRKRNTAGLEPDEALGLQKCKIESEGMPFAIVPYT